MLHVIDVMSSTADLKHGLLGSGEVLALVAPDSGVDWLCLPRFDSPSVCARLLDPNGGTFRVEGQPREMRYLEDSMTLETELDVDGGTVLVRDVCPRGARELVRTIHRVSGSPEVRFEVDLRPDYGEREAQAEVLAHSVRFTDQMQINANVDASALMQGRPLHLDDGPIAIVLSAGAPVTDVSDALEAQDRDTRAWQTWCAALPDEPVLRRSALTLQSHVYQPTGAIIAAATTSLPEAVGEPRNWDYRYAWIRDGSLATEALLRLGKSEAAIRFLDFLERTIGESVPQPLYGIGGERSLEERTLDHLEGFRGSRPVRVGNAAADQVQHDVFGQIVWLAERTHAVTGVPPTEERFRWLTTMIHHARDHVDTVDSGIWEFRDRPRHYTFSQLWAWVAFDRGARLAEALGQSDLAAEWSTLASEKRATILRAADRVGFFAQTLDCDTPDASSLLVASLGLVDADDPRFIQTVRRCEQELLKDGLMARYLIRDDFGETTSTFSLCTLWWVEALARIGEREKAHAALSHFLEFQNPVGLFSEDIAQGELLGNFPQVYTHTGLIQALLHL